MDQPQAQEHGATGSLASKSGTTILVVDDDAAICDIIHQTLEEAGYHTRCASDGESALAAVRDQQPDLILLDVRMPGITGWDVLGRLRAEAGPQCPIVIMTGQYEGQDQALASGAQGYLAKPFDLDDLLACVDLHANLHLGTDTVEELRSGGAGSAV